MREIERKFLIKDLPDLTGHEPVRSERYFLFNRNGIELRIQHKGGKYELERKIKETNMSRAGTKIGLTKKEYDELKKCGSQEIIRDNYYLEDGVSIKVYKGHFAGLIRAEIEFKNETEAQNYKPELWMGSEITGSELANDSKLAKLDKPKFLELLTTFSRH
jgi:adenylate cyclase